MKESADLSSTRREYQAESLRRKDLCDDPVKQFSLWMETALSVSPDDATSMVLATADAEGMPAARIVLLKHFGPEGFAWYTDYRSDKGRQLQENPQAELLFYWYGLERQVRICGRVEQLTAAQADEYFQQRPVGSRMSAAASCQSHPIENREALENTVKKLQARYPQGDVPRPSLWGGYILIPQRYEFWQGRENRLHDRFRYSLQDNGEWCVERLQP
ncbi:pyridoxamine 5'-phosphate oxidase [Neptuniibacter sp. CAU 1671]|uniref:pyridoxamine 5'-phosphate oxidase n=1 Tax=Neptuniibacter sp. CAU 1671 TaxID=3032593 RepID=UPI0023DAF3B6|nr:pyridoxamine 5'-phosphate oxidase [Neptuniibacter sp. CAU 1671]MDF2181858.1 pyridoxamine 5'-phosphate oxidase [Neptuniibacter sp. CAU 1671]